MNSIVNWVMRHLLDYNCNMCTVFEDQLNTLNVVEIWNDNVFPLDSNNAFLS